MPLPAWLGAMTGLRELNLWFNDLTGTLPVALSRLTGLEDLYLSHNGFTGRIPEELGRLTALRVLHLSYNDLTGSIPEELGNRTNLHTLGLFRQAYLPADDSGQKRPFPRGLLLNGPTERPCRLTHREGEWRRL